MGCMYVIRHNQIRQAFFRESPNEKQNVKTFEPKYFLTLADFSLNKSLVNFEKSARVPNAQTLCPQFIDDDSMMTQSMSFSIGSLTDVLSFENSCT